MNTKDITVSSTLFCIKSDKPMCVLDKPMCCWISLIVWYKVNFGFLLTNYLVYRQNSTKSSSIQHGISEKRGEACGTEIPVHVLSNKNLDVTMLWSLVIFSWIVYLCLQR